MPTTLAWSVFVYRGGIPHLVDNKSLTTLFTVGVYFML